MPLKIPPGAANATISFIDTTARISNIPSSIFFTPQSSLPDFPTIPPLPCWVILIRHSSGKNLLFDLGIRKDWENLSPVTADRVKGYGWDIKIEKNVSEILVENGVELGEIDYVVWSHHHWDHVGNPALFPSSTELIVGPGFKKAFFPGYPARKDSPILEADHAGREVREISFSEPEVFKIGQLNALDFFGDGSMYFLDTPGHTIGHLSLLVRTSSSPDTFVFLGGDLCHHLGEIRPSTHQPLPAEINPHPIARFRPSPCPGSVFVDLQEKRSRTRDQTFFDLSMGHDIPEATKTIHKSQEFDGDEDVFFISAHDPDLEGIVGKFPDETANDWKRKGWEKEARWAFLKDFENSVAL